MLCAIEGPDGGGKTTLVDKIKKLLPDAKYLHFGPPKTWPLEEYVLALQDYVPGSGQHIVCDRLHLGEWVYGPVYRGGSQLNEAAMLFMSAFLQAKGAVIAYMDAPDGELIDRVARRGDDYINIEHLPRLARAYRVLRRDEQCTHLVNPTHQMLLSSGGLAERRALVAGNLNSYVGNPNPRIVFVGDKKSDMAGSFKQAFVPWPHRSGEYLMNAINHAGIRDWGVLNQADDNLADAWFQLGEPKLIALGSEALSKFTCAGLVSHGSITHPAYALRFNVQISRYALALSAAVAGQHMTNQRIKEMT